MTTQNLLSTRSVFIIDNQCFCLKKVGNSKYAFYTLSKRPLLTYLTFFMDVRGVIARFMLQKYELFWIYEQYKPGVWL